jgi:3-methyladenine DNA glycosylase AlkD
MRGSANFISIGIFEMKLITSRHEIKDILEKVVADYGSHGNIGVTDLLLKEAFSKKIRFPLLEYLGIELYKAIPVKDHESITDAIVAQDTIGGYVVAGIMLQQKLSSSLHHSIALAEKYIVAGDKWYVCDIVGERVPGHSLLLFPEDTYPILERMAVNQNKWIVRSVGVATHYAVKNGLKKVDVERMFLLLLFLSDTTDFHTKKGVGWAVKTIAKFHPEIIEKYTAQINDDRVKQWFRTKINIGLGRTSKYAHRYTG